MSVRTRLDQLKPRPKWVRHFLNYFAILFGIILAKFVVRGRHHLPNKGPFILALNHFNYADGPFVIYAIRKPINFIVASDQLLKWFDYWAPWLYGIIPANRIRLAPSTIKSSKKALLAKEILLIFPEGTSLSNELRPAKGGVMFLSTTMQVPIVPVSINGKIGDIWSNVLSGVRPKVRINIGKPFGPYSLPKERSQKEIKLAKIGDEVMCRIAALLPDKHHGVYRGNPSIKNYREENNL